MPGVHDYPPDFEVNLPTRAIADFGSRERGFDYFNGKEVSICGASIFIFFYLLDSLLLNPGLAHADAGVPLIFLTFLQ